MIPSWPNFLADLPLKSLLTALVLPPVPWLALAMWGGFRMRRRRRGGMALLAGACAGLWLTNCDAVVAKLENWLLDEPAALDANDRARLAYRRRQGEPIAIVVLGSGVQAWAPEYQGPTLTPTSAERLRYGLWLGRDTGIPVGFAGGLSPAQDAPGVTEGEVAAGMARTQFGLPLKWVDHDSRTTQENADRIVPSLARSGVREVCVVTHGWHMPRALRSFKRATARWAPDMVVRAAPMGSAWTPMRASLGWLPSGDAQPRLRSVLREALAGWIEPFLPNSAQPTPQNGEAPFTMK